MKRLQGLAALGERNYALYWFGHFTSQTGTWIDNTATSWLLYVLTDSPLLLGLGGLFRAVPLVLLAPIGGALADRFSRRRTLLVTETSALALALGLGLLVATGLVQYWHVYLFNLGNGLLSAFSVPARQALFPGLVPRERMASAVTLNAVAVRAAGLVGPPCAGLLLAQVGLAAPYFLDAASYVAMLVALLAMKLPAAGPRPAGSDGAEALPPLRAQVLDGARFLTASPVLTAVIGLEAVSSLLGHNVALITIFSRDVLGLGPEGLGVLLGALSAGALLGMVAMVSLAGVQRRGLLLLLAGGCYGALLVGLAGTRSLTAAAAVLCLLGLFHAVWAVSRNTVVQLSVPDHLRGRVMALVIVVTRGFTPLGQLQTGVAVSLLSAPLAVVVGGVAILGAVALNAARNPALREFGAATPATEPTPQTSG